jgi:hypothetical protein
MSPLRGLAKARKFIGLFGTTKVLAEKRIFAATSGLQGLKPNVTYFARDALFFCGPFPPKCHPERSAARNLTTTTMIGAE